MMAEPDENGGQVLRDTVERLQAEVTELRDRQEILACLHRYAKGLDRRDWDLFASAYHADAIDQHGDFVGGPDGLVEYVSGLMADWDYSVHFLDLNNLEIEGDVAHSECYVLFTQQRVDGTGLDFGGGRYVDRLERRSGAWAIAARRVVVDWSARAESVTFADVPSARTGTFDRNDPSYQRPLTIEIP